MFDKKGISPIIATVLIILLTVTAVAVLAGFIIPFVRESLTGATECIPYVDYFQFDERFDFNCRNGSGTYITIRAGFPGRGGEEVPNALSLVFLSETGSKSVNIKEGEVGANISTLGVTNLEVPEGGEVWSYLYSDGGSFKSAEVYPVLESGKTCDRSDSIMIRLGC